LFQKKKTRKKQSGATEDAIGGGGKRATKLLKKKRREKNSILWPWKAVGSDCVTTDNPNKNGKTVRSRRLAYAFIKKRGESVKKGRGKKNSLSPGRIYNPPPPSKRRRS